MEYVVKDAELKKVLNCYNNHGLGYGFHAQNTVVNLDDQNIIHYPREVDFPEHKNNPNFNQSQPMVWLSIPKKISDMTLADALRNAEATKYVQNLTGLEDPSVLVQIGNYFRKALYLWSSANSGARTAWICCNYSNLGLCTHTFLATAGTTRGMYTGPILKSRGAP